MHLSQIRLFHYPVPFKTVFRHASASRSQAENLIAAAYSDCGQVGYGEGCPRSYVTGETVRSSVKFVEECSDSIIRNVVDVDSLREWITANSGVIDRNPAAFCAVEVALLDLIGKVEGRPVEDIVGAPALSGDFSYSAVLGDAPQLVYRGQFRRYWNNGFRDFKVKISGDAKRNYKKLAVFQKKNDPSLRVRLDANNRWREADECVANLASLPFRVFAVEEPLQAGDIDGFRRVGEECGTKIVLDESFARSEQLSLLGDTERWIVNVRVSKMGGIIRSLRAALAASTQGVGVIVGAQVGETSILTRSALTIMNAVKPHLAAAEGAFGTFLLREDLTTTCLMFGPGGKLSARQANPSAAGLGLEVHRDRLLELP